MVKDLAEAEESCWEAAYYKSVTNAMDTHAENEGYRESSFMRSATASDHGDIITKLSEEYKRLSPEEKMMMKSKVLTTLGSM